MPHCKKQRCHGFRKVQQKTFCIMARLSDKATVETSEKREFDCVSLKTFHKKFTDFKSKCQKRGRQP